MAEYNPSKIIKDGNTYNFRDDTKIPLAGSNEISGSLIPSATDTYNFGGPSYQWNNAYIKSLTINGVAAGDILTHNASEFVDVTGAQTIGGVKTFTSNITIQGGKKVICNIDNSFIELDGGTTWGKGGSIVLSGKDRSSYTNSVLIVSKSDTNTDMIQYQNGELKPLSNNTNDSALGTSTNKWKSFNGLNPGALSLPGNYINVDTTNWVLDGSDANIFNPDSDGWLGIQATDTVYDQMHYVFVGRTGGGSTYYQQNLISPISALWDSKYHGCIFIPVIKNINYDIRCICSSIVATFYPCQGNV